MDPSERSTPENRKPRYTLSRQPAANKIQTNKTSYNRLNLKLH